MKKYILIGLCILFCSLALAVECQDETDLDDIPCTVITPILSCVDFVYNVTDASTGSIVQEGNLTAVGDGTYSFSFTQDRGSYNVFVCETSAPQATISVGDFTVEISAVNWGVLFILIFGWAIFIIGLIFKEDTLTVISSFLLLISGLYMFQNGFFKLDDFTVQWFSIIQILIGGYILIRYTWEQYRDY